MLRSLVVLVALVILALTQTTVADEPSRPSPVRVFLLAGQSNMEGQGVVDLDHPQYYNGGKGTLLHAMKHSKTPEIYSHIQDESGNWIARDDVWIRFKTQHELKRGPLSIGFAGYPGKHHIGPEFQFGHVVGAALEEPVLLVKTAWGGKSLHKDFRPPGLKGGPGPYYTQMIQEYQQAIKSLDGEFTNLAGREVELSGFVWMQGWNDMFDQEARESYELNLVQLIHDVRKSLNAPDLPVVIGELGNGGPEAGANMMAIRTAQRKVAQREAWKGRVAFVPTAAFARPKELSPNVGHGHHWFGNAESYFLIGDALGKAMLKLIKR